MSDRRGTYFAFQGLLLAVLLLLFLYEYPKAEGWLIRFYFLLATLTISLAAIRLASNRSLGQWWFQAGLFVGDACLASLVLRWTEPQSELYLIYFLIIFGTALTRSFKQSFIVAVACSLLYLLSSWRPKLGFPDDTSFWLRVHFLWITSSLAAILSRDSQRVQRDQEQKYQERLIQIGRLATLGQVAGEVAHRIKAPLTTILVNTDVLSHRPGLPKDMLKELDQIRDEVGRCKEILKNLLDLGRIEEMDVTPLDLREPIRSALESIEPQIKKYGIWLQTSGIDKPLKIRGDQSLLHEAISAVLQNAVDATREGGFIRLSAERRGGGWWRGIRQSDALLIVVEDDGKGIKPEHVERVFEPFFTTKGKEGSGLGLSAALRIFQKHGGSIEAQSEGPGKGARFTLQLPVAGGKGRARAADPSRLD
ncbi:MAG: HAMP domain-containing histidine kinase [Elusimicrobia bacterium]|nr:HAMP domain-containing histidine kinase [Elusimicrobiota bacterium]